MSEARHSNTVIRHQKKDSEIFHFYALFLTCPTALELKLITYQNRKMYFYFEVLTMSDVILNIGLNKLLFIDMANFLYSP